MSANTITTSDLPVPMFQPEPETFNEILAEVGMSQTSFVTWLRGNGDDRDVATIRRAVSRLASGETPLSGPTKVLMNYLRKVRGKARRVAEALPWLEDPEEGYRANTSDGYTLRLRPQTYGRWKASVYETKNPSNDASYHEFQPSITAGKIEAAIMLSELREHVEYSLRQEAP